MNALLAQIDFNLFLAPFDQIIKNPDCLSLILPISLVAYVLEDWNLFPSKRILPVCMFLGCVLLPFMVEWPAGKTPMLHVVLNGMVLGFVSFLCHSQLVTRLIEKFGKPKDDSAVKVQSTTVATTTTTITPPIDPPKP